MIKKSTPPEKKNYLPPEVIAVSVVVEQGYQTSRLAPLELETWNEASSSGESFWGNANTDVGSNEDYGTFSWGW